MARLIGSGTVAALESFVTSLSKDGTSLSGMVWVSGLLVLCSLFLWVLAIPIGMEIAVAAFSKSRCRSVLQTDTNQ